MLISNLPNPREYKNFTPKAPIITYKEKKYNLQDEVKKFDLHFTSTIIYFELIEMFGRKFIGSLDFQHNKNLKAVNSETVKLKSIISHYKDKYGYIHTHSSLVILLYDKEELKTAAIRRHKTTSGELIKWYKIKGSSAKFIPYRLTDNYSYCFVAFGMAEALIFNILGLEYFILQSDGEAYNLPSNPYFKAIKEKLKGMDILILPDYDESGFKAATALKAHLKSITDPRIIEFYKLVNNPKKGFDFRDYILQIQDKDLIIENLINLI
jgi:hypothetical protein